MLDNFWIESNGCIYPGVVRQGSEEVNRNVILLPGFGYPMCDKDYFMSRVANRLCETKSRVFQFDLSGHGDSLIGLSDVDLAILEQDLDNILNYIAKRKKDIVIVGRGILVSLALKVLCQKKYGFIRLLLGFNPYFIKNNDVQKCLNSLRDYGDNLIETLNKNSDFIHIIHAMGAEVDYINGERISLKIIEQLMKLDMKYYFHNYVGKKIFLFSGNSMDYSIESVNEKNVDEYLKMDKRLDAMLPPNSFWQFELLEKIASYIEVDR